jgi:hypothetical protein
MAAKQEQQLPEWAKRLGESLLQRATLQIGKRKPIYASREDSDPVNPTAPQVNRNMKYTWCLRAWAAKDGKKQKEYEVCEIIRDSMKYYLYENEYAVIASEIDCRGNTAKYWQIRVSFAVPGRPETQERIKEFLLAFRVSLPFIHYAISAKEPDDETWETIWMSSRVPDRMA